MGQPAKQAGKEARDVFTLSRKIEEVMHDQAEMFIDLAKKGPVDPDEVDRIVDEGRDKVVLPVAQYVKRSSRR